MIKGLKSFLIVLILLVVCSTTNVFAINVGDKGTKSDTISYGSVQYSGGTMPVNIYKIDVNEVTYDSYCLDPGHEVVCSNYVVSAVYNSNNPMAYIYNATSDPIVKSMALRMYYIRALSGGMDNASDSKYQAFLEGGSYSLTDPKASEAEKIYQAALSYSGNGLSGLGDSVNYTVDSVNNPDGTVTVTVKFTTPIKYDSVTSTGDVVVNPAGVYVSGQEYSEMSFIISGAGVNDCDYSFTINYKGGPVDSGAVYWLTPAPGCNGGQAMAAKLATGDNSNGDDTNSITIDGSDICTASCDARIEMPQICDDNASVTDDDRAAYQFKEGLANSGYDIEKCITKKNSQDPAGNKYELKELSEAAIVSDNKYCTVSCKEEYTFNVPYKIGTENGRYFKFGMEISSRQDCYISKTKKSKYETDVWNAQKKVMDAYNAWERLKELADRGAMGGTASDISCSYNCCSTSKNSDGEDVCSCSLGNSYSGTNINFEFKGTYYQAHDGSKTITADGPKPASESFGHFESTSGTCPSGCGSCTYHSPQEDYNKVYSDSKLAAAQQNVANAVEELHKIIDRYNGCINAGTEYVSGYSNAFSGNMVWNFPYSLESKISYTYDEPIIENEKWINQVSESKQILEKSTQTNIVQDAAQICEAGYDANGNCASGDAGTETKSYFSCDKSGLNCGNGKNYTVTNNRYAHLAKIAEPTEFITPKVYYSLHDSGTIIISELSREEVEQKYGDAEQVDGLPIALSTPKGTYFYVLRFKEVGSYFGNRNKKYGRIFGGTDGNGAHSIASVIRTDANTISDPNQESKKVAPNEYACTYVVSEDKDNNKYCVKHGGDYYVCKGKKYKENKCQISTKADVKKMIEDGDIYEGKCFDDKNGYCVKEAQAYYVCPTASYSSACVPFSTREAALNASAENYNCCPECSVFCIGGRCIYEPTDGKDRGQVLLDFRTITPSNIKPNNRELGYNWNTKKAKNNKLVAEKAKNTINEIEARVNVDVDTASDNKINSVNDYTLKVKMTPDMAAKIKEYNRKQEGKGSYNNDTLTCADYTVDKYNGNKASCTKAGYTFEDNKCKAPNVFCYSSFIDSLVNGDFGGEVDAKNRANAKNATFKAYSNPGANVETSAGKLVTNDYWTVNIYNSLCVDENRNAGGTCSETNYPVVGPSWK